MKYLTLTLLAVAFGYASNAQDPEAQQTLSNVDVQFFIENQGQWPDEVLYLTRLGGLDVWITKQGVNYTFYRIEEDIGMSAKKEGERRPGGKFGHEDMENTTMLYHRVILDLIGSSDNPGSEGMQKQAAYYNYFIGNDDRWHASNVGLYKEAIIKEVYKGIDVRYYFVNGNLRYDYIVKPGADPGQIQFRLRGQYDDYLKEQDLAFTTRFGEAGLGELFTYQNNKAIESWFVKQNNSWQIALGKYDHDQTLIIDPLLYSTYIGGSSYDRGYAISVDGSGNAYVTGYVSSTNYDVITGAFQSNHGGVQDVFVTKLNATGTALIYSTYIGGSNLDNGYGIRIDSSGNSYVSGITYSTDYDVTTGAFQTSNGGSYDVFVTKLNAMGSALIYSTYIGGSNNDESFAISVDGSGNAYITGATKSTNYDVTTGAFQTSYGGSDDVIVTKLNVSGTALLYSTYIGGTGSDVGDAIIVDSSGNAYITGSTSSGYDVTTGAFQTSFGGGSDVFVTKLNATGTALIYSTYIGGSNTDYGYAISVDGSGNAYVTGPTESTNYDVTTGAFQTSNGGSYDVFVTKLNATGTALIYSTYIGGSSADWAYAISVDGSGNAYVTGFTGSTNYDVTTGAFQISKGGGSTDAFVTKLNATGTALFYSTYVGGSSFDHGYGIGVDGSGNAYVTGYTVSTNYHVTTGAFQSSHGGSDDVFVTKLRPCGSTFDTLAATTCNSYTWAASGLTYTVSGVYTDTLTNAAGCDSVVALNLIVNSSNSGSETVSACDGYTWAANSLTYTSSGIYSDTLTNTAGCDSVVTLNLIVNSSSSGSETVSSCNSYTWAANSLTYTASGVYTDTLANTAGCDSVVTLNLTINSNSGSESVTACDSYTWAASSLTYTASGVYTYTLTNAAGCDSVVTLNLTINNNSGSESVTACDSYIWAASSLTYTASGVYTDTLTNAAGCDSVVTLNLTINSSNSGSETVSACNSYYWTASNLTYTTSGVYTDSLTNIAGCDSVVTLNLTIYSSNSGSEIVSACNSYYWTASSLTYTASGVYTDTLTNSVGCDSVVTLNLTINNSNSGSETIAACNSYTWAANSLTYTASGVYTDTLSNAVGCDSVITLNLTINTADVSVTNTSPTLTANATGASYQWLDCNNNMAVIGGETNQTFTATANGNYAVEVSQNGCTDTSVCLPVLNVRVEENSFDKLISAYPNPTGGTLNIELNNLYNSITIVVRNELGQEVKQMTFSNASKFQLDIPGQNGVYFIEVKTGDKKAILKVIKE